MSQVTIYLEQTQLNQIKKAARSEKLSLSRWIAKEMSSKRVSSWSSEVQSAAGTWNDFPEIEDLRKSIGKDAPRMCL